MELEPIGKRVLIKPIEEKEEKTKGGIYIPESAQEESKKGEVIAIGKGIDKEEEIPLEKGDKVIYSGSGMSSEEVEIGGEKFIFIDFKDILAKINSDKHDKNE